jgi:chemotaxis protein MotA
MDIATVIGLVGAFAMVLMAILLGGSLGMFIDPVSLLIVVGGSIFVMMMRSSLADFLKLGGILGKAFGAKVDDPVDLINQLVELGTLARKDGMIALEGQEISNPFLAKGIGMLVDGTDPGMIKSSLHNDLGGMKLRHELGAAILDAGEKYAPAMGMIGTLVGLVQMLSNMSDPKSIGPAMAVALLTTMYGAILANMVFGPMAEKIKDYSAKEANNCALIIEGIMFIQSGGNPRLMGDLLASFIAPKARASLAAG